MTESKKTMNSNTIRIPDNLILVIFGASGDLTERKLIPSLFELYCQDLLPAGFVVLGVSRSPMDNDSFREKLLQGPLGNLMKAPGNCNKASGFLKSLHYLSIDTGDESAYVRLRETLMDLDFRFGTSGNHIFYLATPPGLYMVIPKFLAVHGMNKSPAGPGARKIVIEKPFGTDLQSARELNQFLLKYFDEQQIYRIDHYLGKETVQNLLVTRFANGIFEPLWNRQYISRVEITAAENIGIENRGGYYDKAGALRDMVQNHLLQLTGLVAMEPPLMMDPDSIRNEIARVFQALKPYKEEEIEKHVIRGQYLESVLKNETITAYRDERGVDPLSRTETYVAMKLFIDNWRWAGVPFYIRTGKRLPTRVSEVVVYFRPAPLSLFQQNNTPFPVASNQLIIRIQPDEGILLKFGMKVPGAGFHVQEVNMDFHYKDLSDVRLPDAYERLLHDCMLGDSTLYARGDSQEASWAFVDPVLRFWKNNTDSRLFGYPAGTWGPEATRILFDEPGQEWRYPCRNLANDGVFCEL